MWLMLKNERGPLPPRLNLLLLTFESVLFDSASALSLGGTHPSRGHHRASGRHLGLRDALHRDVQKETTRYPPLCAAPSPLRPLLSTL